MKIRNRIIAAGAAALFGLLSFASAPLHAYPAKPIKLIVPYTPGGAADQLARVLGNRFGKDLGQAVIVENKPGANTAIGAQHVAQAAPDGYTIFLASSASMVLNPLLYSKLAYNPGARSCAGLAPHHAAAGDGGQSVAARQDCR